MDSVNSIPVYVLKLPHDMAMSRSWLIEFRPSVKPFGEARLGAGNPVLGFPLLKVRKDSLEALL